MIDTIRFKIVVTSSVFQHIKSRSKVKYEVDKEQNIIQFRVFTKDVEIGSYDYHINIIADNKNLNTIFLEFSLPKVFYGHNIYLYYPPIDTVLGTVHQALEKHFGISFPYYDTWIVQRLDICYAWKLVIQEEAYIAFLLLNPYEQSRKQKTSHDTSFEVTGPSYDFKGYLKYDEFKVHDFKRFKKLKKLELAYEFWQIAKGVFRIELRLRKKKLLSMFKKEITYKDINNTKLLQDILREHFSKFLKHADTKVIKTHEALLKLSLVFKPSKALRLHDFYQAWHHPNASIRAKNRREYKQRLHPTTLWRKHNDLKKAKVGIPNHDFTFDFDFSIPSKYVVNIANAPSALVAEQEKKEQ